jgi:hypothetical protein
LQGYLFAACLSHVEHLITVGYLIIVKRCYLINKVWVSQYLSQYLSILPQLRKEEYCVMWLNNLPKILDHYTTCSLSDEP